MPLNSFQRNLVFSRNVSSPAISPMLDTVGTAYTAYGFEKLRAAYAGSCIRARLDDTTEQDIGFGSDGKIDRTALLAFANGGNAYIKKWYDQSGNAKDLDITTFVAANAGKVVDAGTLVTDSLGNVGAKFDGPNTSQSANNALTHATCHPTGDHTAVVFAQPLNTQANAFGHIYQGTNQGLYWGNNINGYYSCLYKHGGSMPTPSRVQSMGGAPELIHAVTDLTANTVNMWQNGQQTHLNQAISNYTPSAQIRIGYDSAVYSLKGIVSMLVLYARLLNTSELRNTYLFAQQYKQMGKPNLVVMAGDSQTIATTSTYSSYAFSMRPYLNTARVTQFLNDGVNGHTLNNMETRATTANLGTDLLTYLDPDPNAILIAWGGTNDIAVSGDSAATAYSDLVTYITNRKATGKYKRIVSMTSLPRLNGTITGTTFSYNALQRTGMTGSGTLRAAGCDTLIDLNTLSQFDADGDYNDTTYFNADKIHLITAGLNVLGPYMKQVVGLP